MEHGYGSSWGYLPLRERICLSMAERSIRCTPDQVLLTHGANHAMDLIMRDMLEPGDAVLVDDPGYYPLYGKLRLAKARVVGIRRTPDGPDLDDLAAKVVGLRPKLFFTQSLAHNPTGGSLSLPVAHGLLQLAERHDFHIVEDDPFADILPAASPRLAALDQLRRVLYVGTFSKTLSASLRVGYVAGHPKTVAVAGRHQAADHGRDIGPCGAVRGPLDLRRALPAPFPQAAWPGGGGDVARGDRPRRDGAARGAAAGWRVLSVGRAAGRVSTSWSCAGRRRRAASSWRLAACSGRIGRRTPPALRINVAHASNTRFLDFLRQTLAG